jgi:hypothetical protein
MPVVPGHQVLDLLERFPRVHVLESAASASHRGPTLYVRSVKRLPDQSCRQLRQYRPGF